MPENPIDILKLQAQLLNRIVTLEENQQKQLDLAIQYQEHHQHSLDKIARAATLYFWLTVFSLACALITIIFNVGLLLTVLKFMGAQIK